MGWDTVSPVGFWRGKDLASERTMRIFLEGGVLEVVLVVVQVVVVSAMVDEVLIIV